MASPYTPARRSHNLATGLATSVSTPQITPTTPCTGGFHNKAGLHDSLRALSTTTQPFSSDEVIFEDENQGQLSLDADKRLSLAYRGETQRLHLSPIRSSDALLHSSYSQVILSSPSNEAALKALRRRERVHITEKVDLVTELIELDGLRYIPGQDPRSPEEKSQGMVDFLTLAPDTSTDLSMYEPELSSSESSDTGHTGLDSPLVTSMSDIQIAISSPAASVKAQYGPASPTPDPCDATLIFMKPSQVSNRAVCNPMSADHDYKVKRKPVPSKNRQLTPPSTAAVEDVDRTPRATPASHLDNRLPAISVSPLITRRGLEASMSTPLIMPPAFSGDKSKKHDGHSRPIDGHTTSYSLSDKARGFVGGLVGSRDISPSNEIKEISWPTNFTKVSGYNYSAVVTAQASPQVKQNTSRGLDSSRSGPASSGSQEDGTPLPIPIQTPDDPLAFLGFPFDPKLDGYSPVGRRKGFHVRGSPAIASASGTSISYLSTVADSDYSPDMRDCDLGLSAGPSRSASSLASPLKTEKSGFFGKLINRH